MEITAAKIKELDSVQTIGAYESLLLCQLEHKLLLSKAYRGFGPD